MTAERDELKLPPIRCASLTMARGLEVVRRGKLHGMRDYLARCRGEYERLRAAEREDDADHALRALEELEERYRLLANEVDPLFWERHWNSNPTELLLDRGERPGPVTRRWGR